MIFKKSLLVATPVLILLCAGIWAVYEYRKPHTGVSGKSTNIYTDAAKLYNDFSIDEPTANTKYINKVIEVTGTIDDIQNTNGALIIVLKANQSFAGVSCKMFDPKNNYHSKGEKITIKGICSGFLNDVNLVDCVLKIN